MADSPPSPESCWFGTNKPQGNENVPRQGSFDLTKTPCCSERKTLHDVFSKYKGRHKLFEFGTPLELLLFRANGELSFDKEEALSRVICVNHLNSLFSSWAKSGHVFYIRKTLCSLPATYHPETRETGTCLINKSQAVRWMDLKGELIHPGIHICPNHKMILYPKKPAANHMDDIITMEDYPQSMDNDDSMDVSMIPNQQEQNDDIYASILVFLASICNILGISRLLSNMKWCDLEDESKAKKKRAFRTLVTALAKSIAGDNYEELMELTVVKCKCPKDYGDEFMNAIAAKYSSSTTRKDKLELLSIVLSVKGFCHKKISTFMSVTKHQIRTAIAYSKGLFSIVKYKRVRFDRDSVYEFIKFLARSCLIASLPYGDSKATLSDGTKVNVASVCRLYSYGRIIREYYAELKRIGKFGSHYLGKTTLYLMLKSIASKKNRRLYCVDEFLGEAHSAFNNLESSVTKLFEMNQISADEKTVFRQGLRVIRSFLETEYRTHIQETSEIGSHCAAHALSDPTETDFATRCMHTHDYLCLQCEQVDSVLSSIVEKAKELGDLSLSSNHPLSVEIRRIYELILMASTSIFKYRKHLLRSAASDSARNDIQRNLEDGECLLTIDYAMKLLASSSLETQSGFYAKKGVPFHIGHALARIGPRLVHHVFGHLIREGEQDCDGTTAILRHTFEELERLGVTKVTLRSDNAATFKAASVLGALQSLSALTPLIVRYAFSETQSGKGPCDRAAGYLKRSIVGWNESGKDSTNPKQMYEALIEAPPKGCSIYLVDIKAAKILTKKNPIPGITSYFDFEFKKEGLLVRKYAGVGAGRMIPNGKLIPNKSYLTVSEEGGCLERTNCWVTLKTDGRDSTTNVDENEFDLVEEPYRCSVMNCIRRFSTLEELEIHEYSQLHDLGNVKETILDIAIKEFATAIETEECAKVAVHQNSMSINRCDVNTHRRGWAMKEGRAPSMDSEVKEVAEKFFFDNRAVGKRASPWECCELISSMMDDTTGYYRFPLALCPTEKSLTSTFGNWENRRIRPKAVASKGRGRPKKNLLPQPSLAKAQKRAIGELSDEEVMEAEEDEEEFDEENVEDEEIMMAIVEESFNEIFHR